MNTLSLVAGAIAVAVVTGAVLGVVIRRRRAQRRRVGAGSEVPPPGTTAGRADLEESDEFFAALVLPSLDAPIENDRKQGLDTDTKSEYFSRAELFTVGTAAASPRLSHLEQKAIEQELKLHDGRTQDWRQSRNGHVVQLPENREALVLEHSVRRPSAEDALRRLIDNESRVLSSLGNSRSSVELHWPSEAITSVDGGIRGYFSSALGSEFVTDVGRAERAVRTLPFALDGRGREEPALDGVQRLTLVGAVAEWLYAMHAAGVVFGQLDMSSIAFAQQSLRIAVVDYTTARVLGTGPWTSPPSGPDGDATLEPSSLDDDRRAFSRIAYRLLVPHSGSDVYSLSVPHLQGLGDRQTQRLRWLWERANGVPGSMPTVDEWVSVLSTVNAR